MVRAGDTGPVKVGFTTNLASRLLKMQVDNHERLTVIRLLVGNKADEARIHKRFNHLHLRGEWFVFDNQLLGQLNLADLPLPRKVEGPSYDEVLHSLVKAGLSGMGLIKAHKGMQAKISNGIGITSASVGKWIKVPAERVLHIERITGISRHDLRADLYPREDRAA